MYESDKFEVYIVLRLDCIISFAPLTHGFCTHKTSGNLPWVKLRPENNIEESAHKLFILITGLNPTWARLRFIELKQDEDRLDIYYGAKLTKMDKLIDEYEWKEDHNA